MRQMEFDMERPDLVEVGQEVEVVEKALPYTYYYTIVPALAMSRNIDPDKRLVTRKGKVLKVEPFGTREVVTVEFDEDEPV